MAVQILDKPSLGTLLGGGIGEGLGQLAQQRVQSLQKRQGLSALMPERSTEDIKKLAEMPDDLLKQVIKNYQDQQQNELFSRILAQQQGVQNNPLDSNVEPGDAKDIKDAPKTAEQEAGISRELMQAAQPPMSAKDKLNALLSSGLMKTLTGQRQKMLLDTLMSQQKMEEAEKASKAKTEIAERKLQETTQARIDKKYAKYIEKLNNRGEALRNEEFALDTIENAMDSGKLPSAQAAQLAEFLPVENPQAFLNNPVAEQAQAAIKGYLRNVKEYFGSRPVQWEIQQLLKGLPTIYNTPAGRRGIMNTLRAIHAVSKREREIANRLIEENDGEIPKNFVAKVDKALEPYYKEVREKINDLNKMNMFNKQFDKGRVPELGSRYQNPKTGTIFVYKEGGFAPEEGWD